jgi:hypothetical protein
MSPKLLFVLGIIVAHGALAAGWVAQEAPKQRASISTCVRAPETPPYFAQPRELLARNEIPFAELRIPQP